MTQKSQANFDENMQKLHVFLADSGWRPQMLLMAAEIMVKQDYIERYLEPVRDIYSCEEYSP